MDEAYNQHASQARRKNRSSTNLNHLSLAPLTSKLPLTDPDAVPDALAWPHEHNLSYLQGKSAPTTPALISRSPATPTRSRSRPRGNGSRPASVASASGIGGGSGSLQKSKSASHLAAPAGSGSHHGRRRGRKAVSGTVSPTTARRRRHDDALSRDDRSDSDWLLRAGALISSETRESKGQAWLVSRASSTSLTGLPDPDDAAFERELARERGELASRHASRHASRRGSIAAVGGVVGTDGEFSPSGSGFPSRSHSRVGSRNRLLAPLHGGVGDPGYFDHHDVEGSEYIPGPDFVNLDEKLEAIEQQQDTSQEDEAAVRRLVKNGHAGVAGSWMGSLLGWSLFSVDENDEEEGSLSSRGGDGGGRSGGGSAHPDGAEDEDEDGDEDDDDDVDDEEMRHTGGQEGGRRQRRRRRRRSLSRRFQDDHDVPDEETIPPPTADEGGWKDAAWLLSVATKVLL